MIAEERRDNRLRLLEDHIGRAMAEVEQSGELKSAPSYGKPLQFGDGYNETPLELRMGYKVLKDAGVLPPEVQLMRDIEALQQSVDSFPDQAEVGSQRERLAAMRMQLAMRLERLRTSGAL